VAQQQISPADGGPCPICNEDMAEKVYDAMWFGKDANGELVQLPARGRYWHMSYEHGILENYEQIQQQEVTENTDSR